MRSAAERGGREGEGQAKRSAPGQRRGFLTDYGCAICESSGVRCATAWALPRCWVPGTAALATLGPPNEDERTDALLSPPASDYEDLMPRRPLSPPLCRFTCVSLRLAGFVLLCARYRKHALPLPFTECPQWPRISLARTNSCRVRYQSLHCVRHPLLHWPGRPPWQVF